MNDSKLNKALQEFIELGDAGKIFMTCESAPGNYRVVLKTPTLEDAQAAYSALHDIVLAARERMDKRQRAAMVLFDNSYRTMDSCFDIVDKIIEAMG